jgi:predicted RNase H-like HicB family nuclease
VLEAAGTSYPRRQVARVNLQLTAVYQRVPGGFIALVEELPGANTQGATLDEARTNLREAVKLVIDANRELVEQDVRGCDVIRESIQVTG